MQLDPVFLSRLQFAWVIAWHILLPAFTVGHRFLCRASRRASFRHWARSLFPAVELLDQDFRGVVRHGRRLGRRHAVSVRRQLEPLLRCDRQCPLAVVRLRSPDRVLSRVGVSRRVALRPEACAALGSFRRRADGGGRHALFVLLDSRRQQLDADAGWVRHCRWAFLSEVVDRDRLQPVLPLPANAHSGRLLYYRRPCRRRRRRLLSAARALRRRSAYDVVDDTLAADGVRAAADLSRRPTRAQYACLSAGEARSDRSALGHRQPRAANPVRHSR